MRQEQMSEIVTIELPQALAEQVKEIAAQTHQRLEDVLVAWIDRAVRDLPIESLPDQQVLDLTNIEMLPDQQIALSQLLDGSREGLLNEATTLQLDQLMQIYRRGLVRKARALQVAVSRGLRPVLSITE
jgi:hypothetical protein